MIGRISVDTLINDWTKLGSAIRDARTARNLTQHQLAEAAGVSRSWLARVESGHRGAELEQIFRLLNALGLSMMLHDPKRASSDSKDLTEEPDPNRVTGSTDSASITSPLEKIERNAHQVIRSLATIGRLGAASGTPSAQAIARTRRRRDWEALTEISPDPPDAEANNTETAADE